MRLGKPTRLERQVHDQIIHQKAREWMDERGYEPRAPVLTETEERELRDELDRLREQRRHYSYPPLNHGIDPDANDRPRICNVLDRWIAKFEAELASSSAAVTGEDPS